MKKLLYLFLAITVACSSDDNSNEEPENQLFLDIYDGFVWQVEQPTGDYFSDKVTFYSDPSSFSTLYDGACDTAIFGDSYPFTDDGVVIGEVTYSIQNEELNNIVIFGQFVDNDGNLSPVTRIITCTVSSGGNALLLEDSFAELDTDTYIIAPDEFPCN